MSSLPRSSTGCFTCKCRRKKCDETKPKCLRCQKSGLECPGYIYIQGKNKKVKKLRTLPAPREKKSRARAQDQPPPSPFPLPANPYSLALADNETLPMEPSDDLLDSNFAPIPVESPDLWAYPTHESNPGGSDSMFTNFDQFGAPTSSATFSSSTTGSSSSMTPGQASLFNALFSLGNNPPDPTGSPSSIIVPANHNARSSGSKWTLPEAEEEDSGEEEDPEDVTRIICQPLTLDKNAESNALPFILQNYATWVARMAYEPLKIARLVRDFVVKQFEDGQESRCILTLLANIGGQLGRRVSVDPTHLHMLSILQARVLGRLANAKLIGDADIGRREAVKALDASLETVVIHFFTSPASEWLTLRKEAAPLFRRLCPGPPGSSVNIPSLLQQTDACLWRYVHLDVLCASMLDIPMLFRYDCTPQNTEPDCAVGDARSDAGPQWFHGTPERFIAIFSKINAMREDKWVPTPEIVAVFERGIQDFRPTQDSSPHSFLSVTRLVVQECWRQVAYVYLYMGLCGDSSDTPRVKRAFRQFMKLLDGTKPGRMPDEFLVMNIILIAPAAQKNRDREIIRKRIQGVRDAGRNHGINDNMNMIENYWARADAEGRALTWSDIAHARRQVVGI